MKENNIKEESSPEEVEVISMSENKEDNVVVDPEVEEVIEK